VTRRSLALLALTPLLFPGCTARTAAPDLPRDPVFEGRTAELLPHQPGNRLVYRARGDAGERTLTSLVTPGERDDEFLVTLFNGNLVLGQTRLRDDGRSIAIVSEVGPQQNIAVSYREPLPLIQLPLRLGEQPEFRTTVKILNLSDGAVLAEGEIQQVASVAERKRSFGRRGWYLLHFERTMVLPQRATRARSTIWIEPGIGQVRVEMGTEVDGKPSERRDLVCAVIGGRQVGDCRALAE
jgi:hypothetical protein